MTISQSFWTQHSSAPGAGVPLQHVTMSSSPVCVKETPTIDPSECTNTAMPSQPEPVLKGCATPVGLPGEGKTHNTIRVHLLLQFGCSFLIFP